MIKKNRQQVKKNRYRAFCTKLPLISAISLWGLLWQELPAWAGVPNGTWLSQPQIRFHSSTNTVSHVMRDIHKENYKMVFLDFRGVSDEVQKYVSAEARKNNLIPVVWVQSPQYRSLTVPQLIHEARHGDAIQVDDHFFANYSPREFQALSFQYQKPIFCSIQPFQSDLISQGRCNQLDVQCYTSESFENCIALADRLKAVVSLFDKQTLRYRTKLGTRRFNVFLWPHSERRSSHSSQEQFRWENLLSSPLSLWQLSKTRPSNFSRPSNYSRLSLQSSIDK